MGKKVFIYIKKKRSTPLKHHAVRYKTIFHWQNNINKNKHQVLSCAFVKIIIKYLLALI